MVAAPGANTDRIRGRTLRFHFEDGPTAGTTYEHVFREDGTVEFRSIEDPSSVASVEEQPSPASFVSPEPTTRYGAFEVSGDVWTVSYLSEHGYTLTVALNFSSWKLFGFASNDKEWHPVAGRFSER
jgi:hypothetical protein